MSKFLEILEQHDPSNQSKMNAKFEAMFFLDDHKVRFRSEGINIILHTEKGDVILEVIGFKNTEETFADAEEDESIDASTGTYSVDQEVEKLADKASGGLKGLAAKAWGTKDQKAKSAAKERQNVAGQAIDAYRKGTERIKKGLQAVKTSTMNRTY
jgi:hypothetical protein